MTDPYLSVKDVWKSYDRAGGEVSVLRGVSFTLDAGAAAAIVGPSGSGKSTLLNCIGTLDRPTRGHIRLAGSDVGGGSEAEQAELRSRAIGFVFQSHHLLPQLDVMENVLVPTLAGQGGGAAAVERARRLLVRVGLEHRLTHRPGELSGGERQRVAVVRALINAPRLVLADEPTGSLDRPGAEGLMELLAEINREEETVLLVVTHAEHLAARLGRVMVLQEGVLQAQGAT